MAFDYDDVPDVDMPKRPVMLGKGGLSILAASWIGDPCSSPGLIAVASSR
jgi:hypothetical protein